MASGVQDLEYSLAKISQSTQFMDQYKFEPLCGLCSDMASVPQTILLNKGITKILERLATQICISFGIEGGEPTVCKGAVSIMAD